MCGLAGIISTKKTTFNINQFNILGTLNDERGGDSCGVFIDGAVSYGTGSDKFFRSFTVGHIYPETASIALLHCRKTSPGYVTNLAQAQPIIIKEGEEIKFMLMHNGTISNIQTLAKKYIPEFTTTGLSDSQILAQIIYDCGYDVLQEYEGCAVLIMVDLRVNASQVMIFKGSSCYNEAKENSERPLYYMRSNNKFYYSSMYASLYCIDCKAIIYEFPVNKLCKIEDNKVYKIKEYNRNKLKKVAYCGYNYGLSTYNNSVNYNAECLRYDKATGLYKINGELAHGIYYAYDSGYLMNTKYVVNDYDKPFYIFNGRVLYNKECYEFLMNIDDLFEGDVLLVQCPEIVDYFSFTPHKFKNDYYDVDENFQYVPCPDGTYYTLFDSSRIVIINGAANTFYESSTESKKVYTTLKDTFFNFESLEEQAFTTISNKLVNGIQ